ncbi:MAG: hypothetical protein WHT28_04645 [Fimbriimonadales bacterium]
MLKKRNASAVWHYPLAWRIVAVARHAGRFYRTPSWNPAEVPPAICPEKIGEPDP